MIHSQLLVTPEFPSTKKVICSTSSSTQPYNPTMSNFTNHKLTLRFALAIILLFQATHCTRQILNRQPSDSPIEPPPPVYIISNASEFLFYTAISYVLAEQNRDAWIGRRTSRHVIFRGSKVVLWTAAWSAAVVVNDFLGGLHGWMSLGQSTLVALVEWAVIVGVVTGWIKGRGDWMVVGWIERKEAPRDVDGIRKYVITRDDGSEEEVVLERAKGCQGLLG